MRLGVPGTWSSNYKSVFALLDSFAKIMFVYNKVMAKQFDPGQPITKPCQQIIPLTGVEVKQRLDLDDYKQKTFFFSISLVPGNMEISYTFCCQTSIERDKWIERVAYLSNLAVDLSQMEKDCRVLHQKVFSATTLLKMNVGEKLLENITNGNYKRGTRRYEEVREHLDDYFKTWEDVMSKKMEVHKELSRTKTLSDSSDHRFNSRSKGKSREMPINISAAEREQTDKGDLASKRDQIYDKNLISSELSEPSTHRISDNHVDRSENSHGDVSSDQYSGTFSSTYSDKVSDKVPGDSIVHSSSEATIVTSSGKKTHSSAEDQTVVSSGNRTVRQLEDRNVSPSGVRIDGLSERRSDTASKHRDITGSGKETSNMSNKRTAGLSGKEAILMAASKGKTIGPSQDKLTPPTLSLRSSISEKQKQSKFSTKHNAESYSKSDDKPVDRGASMASAKDKSHESISGNTSGRAVPSVSSRVSSQSERQYLRDVVNKVVSESGGKLPDLGDGRTKKSVLLRKILAEISTKPQSKFDVTKIAAALDK